jgi:DNA-binding MarR family transcriptional regulator
VVESSAAEPQPGLACEDYRAAARLRLALRAFSAPSVRIVRRHGLTPSRYELLLLVAVGETGQVTVGSVARSLSIGQSAATQLVRRAENEGLLARELSREDARVHPLRLTAQGRSRLDAALAELGPERSRLVALVSSSA